MQTTGNTTFIPSKRKPFHVKEQQQPLAGKIALFSGCDLKVNRALALAFAQAGADIVMIYNQNELAVSLAAEEIHDLGRRYLKLKGDAKNMDFCKKAINFTVMRFGTLDTLIDARSFSDIMAEECLTKAAISKLSANASIISTLIIPEDLHSDTTLDFKAVQGALLSTLYGFLGDSKREDIRVNAQTLVTDTDVETVRANFIFLASDEAANINGEIFTRPVSF